MARPTKLNLDLQDKLCNFLQAGATLQAASEACSLTYSSVAAWRLRGEQELKRRHAGMRAKPSEQTFIEFLEALKKSRATAEIGLQNLILASAKGGQETSREVTETFYPDGTLKSRKVSTQTQPKLWQAAAWMLERSFGYTRTDRLVLEQIIKEKIELTLGELQGKLSQDAYTELQELFTRELEKPVHSDGLN